MTDRIALLALGSNLPSQAGSPIDTLRAAVCQIAKSSGLKLAAISRFWTTPAHPAGSGPDYANAAAACFTVLSPVDLLATLHQIESQFGRTRHGARWQSRTVDLDLLAVDDLVLPDIATQDAWRRLPPERQAERAPESLILPHPRLQDRGFVLGPLQDIAPGWRHPRTGQSVAAMLAALGPDALTGMTPIG